MHFLDVTCPPELQAWTQHTNLCLIASRRSRCAPAGPRGSPSVTSITRLQAELRSVLELRAHVAYHDELQELERTGRSALDKLPERAFNGVLEYLVDLSSHDTSTRLLPWQRDVMKEARGIAEGEGDGEGGDFPRLGRSDMVRRIHSHRDRADCRHPAHRTSLIESPSAKCRRRSRR